MGKKVFTKEAIQADIEKFVADEQFNKTTVSLDWMDNYVVMFKPEDMETYANDCALMPTKEAKNGVKRPDVVAVRKYFMEKYFPEYTDEAVAKRKDEAKKKREAEQAEAKRLKGASKQEQILAKLKKLAKEQNNVK